jgi:ATP-dependent Lon protease
MVTAVASLAAGKPVRGDLAMTGEITLRGKVLPVGGIKEKVLAAHRIGIRHVILPKRNERDVEDVPPEARKEMQLHFVDTAEEVLEAALVRPGEPAGAPGRGPVGGDGSMSARGTSRTAKPPRAPRPASPKARKGK